jgi:hypothetical protein
MSLSEVDQRQKADITTACLQGKLMISSNSAIGHRHENAVICGENVDLLTTVVLTGQLHNLSEPLRKLLASASSRS